LSQYLCFTYACQQYNTNAKRKEKKKYVPIDFFGLQFKVEPNEKVHDLSDTTKGKEVLFVLEFVLLNTKDAVNRGIDSNKVKDLGLFESLDACVILHCQVKELRNEKLRKYKTKDFLKLRKQNNKKTIAHLSLALVKFERCQYNVFFVAIFIFPAIFPLLVSAKLTGV